MKGKGAAAKGAPAAAPAPQEAGGDLNEPADATDIAAAVSAATAAALPPVKAATDAYYSSKSNAREPTRPAELPAQQADLLARVSRQLDELKATAAAHITEASGKFRAQVVLAGRELLCLPAAALAALAAHEVQHSADANAATLAAFKAADAELEAQRLTHRAQLRPALAHPAHANELAALRDAEAARAAAAAAAAAKLLRSERPAAGERAVLVARRLAAAAAQAAGLLDGVPQLEDLVDAPEGDSSLSDLPPLNLLQLERWGLALEDAEPLPVVAPAAAAPGRPFAGVTATLPAADLTADVLGWDSALEAAVAAAAGEAEEASAADVAVVAAELPVVDTPAARALVRAHRAAAAAAAAQARQEAGTTVSAVRGAAARAAGWGEGWQEMLSHVAPTAVT